MPFQPWPTCKKLTLGAFCVSCFVFTSYVNFKLNKERYKVFLNALEADSSRRKRPSAARRCFAFPTPIR